MPKIVSDITLQLTSFLVTTSTWFSTNNYHINKLLPMDSNQTPQTHPSRDPASDRQTRITADFSTDTSPIQFVPYENEADSSSKHNKKVGNNLKTTSSERNRKAR